MLCINTDAMSEEWKTIRVPKDVYEDAKARKEEHDVTWGEYVNPHAWHSVFDEPKSVPDDATVSQSTEIDADEVAQVVVERLEGAKPLEDMAFDDWWEPDYAQTIAVSVIDEVEGLDLKWEDEDAVDLTPVMNRIDDLETELTKQHERMGGR